MKKFILDIILLLGIAGLGVVAAFLVTGSRNDGPTPQETIKSFYSSLTAGKWDEAMKSCDTSSMRDYVAEFRKIFEKHHRADSVTSALASRILQGMEVIFKDGTRHKDTYTTHYTLKAGGMDKIKTAVLRREEGKWIITGINAAM